MKVQWDTGKCLLAANPTELEAMPPVSFSVLTRSLRWARYLSVVAIVLASTKKSCRQQPQGMETIL